MAKLASGASPAPAEPPPQQPEQPAGDEPPAAPAEDDSERAAKAARRERRQRRRRQREAAAKSAPEPAPEPAPPPGHGTPLEPLCAALPQLRSVAFTLALRAAALHLIKRDVEVDRRALSAAMPACGLPGRGKLLNACGFLMKEAGRGGGQRRQALVASLGPLGFTAMHIECLVATLAWVKDGAPPGIGDPSVEGSGWRGSAAELAGRADEPEPEPEQPPPPPAEPPSSSSEDEDEGAQASAEGGEEGYVVVAHQQQKGADASTAPRMPFPRQAAPRAASSTSRTPTAPLQENALGWDDSRQLARGRLRRSLEAWLSEAGIGGNQKSSSLRGFDPAPLLEFAEREGMMEAEPERIYERFVDAKVEACAGPTTTHPLHTPLAPVFHDQPPPELLFIVNVCA